MARLDPGPWRGRRHLPRLAAGCVLALAALTAPAPAPAQAQAQAQAQVQDACEQAGPNAMIARGANAAFLLQPVPDPVEVGRPFELRITRCGAQRGGHEGELRIDATMPAHRHGMNYRPSVRAIAPGRFRAEGLLLHMPGQWRIEIELRLPDATERAVHEFELGLGLSPEAIRAVLRHGPWPPAAVRDDSNRASGQGAAIALGGRLFFDTRLSANGAISCASCHAPARGWTDGLARAQALGRHDRNTPTLWNLAGERWFGWDGGSDSLWAHSVRPLLAAHEMGSSAAQVAALLRGSPDLARAYADAFGAPLPLEDQRLLVDAGKALAAYLETLVSPRTPFDAFRDALAAGDWQAAAGYPAAARRGLAIFVGRGNCAACHFGPKFSNGEFHDIGMRFFLDDGRVDPGRHAGIRRVLADPLNRLGRFSDAPDTASAVHTRHVRLEHRNWGEFKVPTLRELARTAPYMHDGSLATLRDVVRHYSELDEERLHADGEALLRPLRLSQAEIDDLVAFLRTLSAQDTMLR